jgi:hypothetical protein
VSPIRLASVAQLVDEHINLLSFAANATGVSIMVPAFANLCLPGNYLFLPDIAGVPSIASIVQVRAAQGVSDAGS